MPAASKVWIWIDTGGTQNAGANSRNSALALFAGDGAGLLWSLAYGDGGSLNGLASGVASSSSPS